MLDNNQIRSHVDTLVAIGSAERNGRELTPDEMQKLTTSAAALICSTLQAIHVIAAAADRAASTLEEKNS